MEHEEQELNHENEDSDGEIKSDKAADDEDEEREPSSEKTELDKLNEDVNEAPVASFPDGEIDHDLDEGEVV